MQFLVLVHAGRSDKLNKARKSSLLLHHVENRLIVDIGEAIEQQHGCDDFKRGRFILLATRQPQS